MKVYLGGKMTGHGDNNWRMEIVDSGVHALGEFGPEYCEANGAELNAACGLGDPPDVWPVLRGAVIGGHDYVGPYLVGCDHGCFHSGDHATSIGWGPEREVEYGPDQELVHEPTEEALREWNIHRAKNRTQIVRLCWKAMATADLLFFWLDRLDAYGSLAELVFFATMIAGAKHSAQKTGETPRSQYLVLASPSFAMIDQMWFGIELARQFCDVQMIESSTPAAALVAALCVIQPQVTDDGMELSPIEQQFMDAWRTAYGNGIIPQFNVPGFRYRVDFAFPSDRVAIELDGYEYHNSHEQFVKDRQRQREIEMAGWRFIRFAGREVYHDAAGCVRQAYEFWQSFRGQHDET